MSVIFENDSREKLIEGVDIIGKAVKTTFGPNGKNVFIKGSSGLHVTKDGATVARYVSDENPFVDMGIELIKKIATKTAEDVGDGTTTSTILAQEIVKTLKDSPDHPIAISRKLQEDVTKVVEFLEENKENISSLEDLIKVATISTNNDEELGKLIGEAYYNVGKEGVVYVEESSDVETTVEYAKGVSMGSGYASAHFINNERSQCEMENVLVYISEFN